MDWARIHSMIVHVPVVLATVGTVAVLLGLVARRRGLWLYGSISLTLASVMMPPAFLTGRLADSHRGRSVSLPSASIRAHEDAALISAALIVIAGLLALVAWRRLVRYPREVAMPPWLRGAVLVTALTGTSSILYTALLGERMRYDSPAPHQTAPKPIQSYPAPGATPND